MKASPETLPSLRINPQLHSVLLWHFSLDNFISWIFEPFCRRQSFKALEATVIVISFYFTHFSISQVDACLFLIVKVGERVDYLTTLCTLLRPPPRVIFQSRVRFPPVMHKQQLRPQLPTQQILQRSRTSSRPLVMRHQPQTIHQVILPVICTFV